MSKFIKIMFSVLMGAMLFLPSVNAATISPAIVGGLDPFVGWCNGVPSGDADEVACINLEGGISITTSDIAKAQGGDLNVMDVDGMSGVVAQLLPTGFNGDYFLMKSGNLTPGPNGPTIVFYIFQNLANADYAVVDLNNELFPFPYENTGQISHFTGIVGTLATPLPGAVWMMITGLGGLFGFRKFSLRRRKTA